MTKNKVCRIFGHKFDRDCIEHYHWYLCERCGYEDLVGDPGITQIIGYKIRGWWWDIKYSFKKWWKCDHCGWHLGQHDPEDPHMPF